MYELNIYVPGTYNKIIYIWRIIYVMVYYVYYM